MKIKVTIEKEIRVRELTLKQLGDICEALDQDGFCLASSCKGCPFSSLENYNGLRTALSEL